ncbi:MAG: hypothetical protein HY879_24475 [Deltaproteobacteria bacterium]|nr:hypothetical protein [Deltaproteobacteria bacterium]
MPASITKISPPAVSGVFRRERLFRLLDDYCRRPIVWISGPPGSGKTTLAATYAQSGSRPSLWYQLDEGDGDLAGFFYYLGLAAQKALPRRKKPLPLLTPEYQAGLPTFTLRYFETLYNHLSSSSAESYLSSPMGYGGKAGKRTRGNRAGQDAFLLIFDNYQEVPIDSRFQAMMAQGLEIIPPGINVLVLSRREPPPALARLRANEKMHLIGWDELRLTAAESRGIVRLKRQNKPAGKIVDDLLAMTDGWVAGLVLLIEAARRQTASFPLTGHLTRDEIFDYFAAEIFNRIDQETQAFLVQTAFLPHMTPQMAGRLTGSDLAGKILTRMTQDNFFTSGYTVQGGSCRYHPLFREFLLSRAPGLFKSERITEIRRVSAKLLEESGQIEEGAELFLQAGDYENVIRLILGQGASLLGQGRNQTLREWLNGLPRQVVETSPWIQYWMGMCCQFDDPAQSRRCFEEAFRAFEGLGEKTGLFLSWAGLVFLLANSLEDIKTLDRWSATFDDLINRFGFIPTEEIELKVLPVLLYSAIHQSKYRDLDVYIERALLLADRSKQIEMKIHLLSNLASCLIVRRGEMHRADMILDQVKHLARKRDIPPINRLSAKFSEILLYTFSARHEACIKAVTEGLKSGEETGIHLLDGKMLMQGAISALNCSEEGGAGWLIEQLATKSATLDRYDYAAYRCLAAIVDFCQNRFETALVHIGRSIATFEEIGQPVALIFTYLVKAQILQASRRFSEAAGYLDTALALALEIKADHLKSASLLIKAHFHFSDGDEKTGLDLLSQALALGRETGNFLTFVWQPFVKAELCARALEAGIEPTYVQELIRRCNLHPPGIWVESWPYPLKIYTLGRFGIINEGRALPFSGKTRQKPLALLKALIAFGGRDVTETQLTDALWPEADGDGAHLSFKFTLHQLRNLLGNGKVLRLKESKVTLDPRYCWVDVWAFRQAAGQVEENFQRTGSLSLSLSERAIALYQKDFLAGEEGSQWIFPMRERLKARFIRLIEMAGRHHEGAGEWEKAATFYQKALDVQDLQEEFYRGIMRCHQKLGRRAEALAIYQQCRMVLDAALGIEPSEETESLCRAIRQK